MLYAILLQQRTDGRFQASVPLIPGLTRVGMSRAETIQAVEQAINATLKTAEVVYLDIPGQPFDATNPWLTTAGIFSDDPTLTPMLHEIYDARDSE